MGFQPGQSGNPAGRPRLPRGEDALKAASIRTALLEVCRKNPRLLADAIERLLRGNRASLGMLELAAKLTGEIKQDADQSGKITIVFTGTLNPNALRQVDAKVIDAEPCQLALKAPEMTSNLSLTTVQDQLVESSLKTQPSVVDFTDLSARVSQPQE